MAAISEYARIVGELIREYAGHKPSYGDIDVEAFIDVEKGHYQIMHVGWQDQRRVHGTTLHIDLIGEKVWIQHDRTDPGIARELVEAGIPREAIVLGFRPPDVRPHTGYAVG